MATKPKPEEEVPYVDLALTKEGREWNDYNSKNIFGEDGWIRFGKVGAVYPTYFKDDYPRIRDFKIRKDDVWVVTFPKCGTTWSQEMVWCIMNDFDVEAAKSKGELQVRAPFFETPAFLTPEAAKAVSPYSFDDLDAFPERRCMKTHLHFSLLPKQLQEASVPGAKIVYVVRNPRDTCVSWFHHSCALQDYKGNLDEFVQHFITGNVLFAPYWPHLREFWEIKDKRKDDILFLTYEDMKKDLPAIIRQTATFLSKPFTEEQVQRLVDHISFENMKNNPAVNYEGVVSEMKRIHGSEKESSFIRKGKVGGWKEEMSPESISKMDKWIQENGIPGLYSD